MGDASSLSRTMNRFGLGSRAFLFTRINYRWDGFRADSLIATIGTFGKGFVSILFMDIVRPFDCSAIPSSALIFHMDT